MELARVIREPTTGIVVGLVLAVFIVFGGALRSDFVRFDDDVYVTENPHVRDGLSWKGFIWAFTGRYESNWIPLTWLSHMLDVSLFGLNPAGHHLTSLCLHAANAVLLFLLLRRLTHRNWPAAWIAAAFAVHPQRVESVVWVAERKDVLCAFFGLLTLVAYARGAESLGGSKRWPAVVLFALGLMSKPMLVTLPLLMLLFDYWPLNRNAGVCMRVREKMPLLVLSALAAALAFATQRASGAMRSLEQFPLDVRLTHAAVAYVEYLRLFVWPSGLAFFYPHPGSRPASVRWISALLLLLLITAVVVRKRRTTPHLFVGWLWFVITLLPVIGIVQIGGHAWADRYTYLPHIGLLVTLGYTLDRLLVRCSRAWFLSFLLLVPYGWAARRQTAVWRDSERLFLNAIAVTSRNWLAHNNLGAWYATKGLFEEARRHLEAATTIQPDYAEAHFNLSNVYLSQGLKTEALEALRRAVTHDPKHVRALNNLAWLLATELDGGASDRAEAVRWALRAYTLARPDDFRVLDTLAAAWAANGRWAIAARLQERAVRLAQEAGLPAESLILRLNQYRQAASP